MSYTQCIGQCIRPVESEVLARYAKSASVTTQDVLFLFPLSTTISCSAALCMRHSWSWSWFRFPCLEIQVSQSALHCGVALEMWAVMSARRLVLRPCRRQQTCYCVCCIPHYTLSMIPLESGANPAPMAGLSSNMCQQITTIVAMLLVAQFRAGNKHSNEGAHSAFPGSCAYCFLSFFVFLLICQTCAEWSCIPDSLQLILHSACDCMCQGIRGHVSGSQGLYIKCLFVSARIILPDTVPLTVQALDPAGAYLLDSMRIFILWLGRNVSAEFMSQVIYILDQLLPTYWTNV